MRLQRRCIQKPNYTNCIYKRLNTASPQSILTNPALPSFPIQILAIRNIFPFLRISFYQSITPPILPSPSKPCVALPHPPQSILAIPDKRQKHPKIQRNAQYRLTKACPHVSEPVDPRHYVSKNTKKHPKMLLPIPSCLERLHTASSQSILIKTAEPLNTRPGLHILPGMPIHPF